MAQKDRIYSARGGLGFMQEHKLGHRAQRRATRARAMHPATRDVAPHLRGLHGRSSLLPGRSDGIVYIGKTAAFFGAIFDIENLPFAKTGSGQTQDRLQRRPLPAGLAPHQPFGGSGRASPGAGGSKRARLVVHDEASRRAGCREVRRSCEWRAGARAGAGGVRWGRSILARSS
jgi:hypothetical protein